MRDRENDSFQVPSDEGSPFSTSWEREERAVYTVDALEREFKALMRTEESQTDVENTTERTE